MTTIDPARLVSILQALSFKNIPNKQGVLNRGKSTGAPVSLVIEKKNYRDKEQLKRNLRERLKRLKSQPDFIEKAPEVVIKEILLWEFGENFISHPEFNFISKNILSQVNSMDVLHKYMSEFIRDKDLEDI